MTLIYKFDLDRIKECTTVPNVCSRCHFVRRLLSGQTDTHKDTHIAPQIRLHYTATKRL